MPHSSLVAAERAAIEGTGGGGGDLDTQQCHALQNELLSSSPAQSQHIASTSINGVLNEAIPAPTEDDIKLQAEHVGGELSTQLQLQPRSRTPKSPQSPQLPQAEEDANVNELTPKTIGRDANGRLRLFDRSRKQRGPSHSDSDQLHHKALSETQAAHTMDDLTQKSSMSLTQENPTSAYEQYDIQRSIRDQFPSNASADDATDPDEGPTQIAIEHDSHGRHASTKTESTAFTYEENDPGHIRLVFNPEPVEMEMDESQDTSYAVPQMEPQIYGQYYEPQTPAPAVNPFSQKGSVLKGSEMFGATQPSSIGRHMASPSSSRPSPDIYNDFTSPPQRRRMLSSPLVRNPQDEDISPLPLQSSVRNLLARTIEGDSPQISAPRTPGVRSFDTGPRIHQAQLNEPRPYVSMKESQERRQQTALDSDSDGSDSDIEAVPRKRRKEREDQIKKELSAVVRMPSSSRPKSSSPAMVEVPSTGRRRSRQEDDYIAQCDGFDAHDTQQDDFIADSQAVPERACSEVNETSQAEPDPESSPAKTTEGEPSQALGSSNLQLNLTNELSRLDDNTTREEAESIPERGNTLQEPSLPLQEVSTNRNDIRTPIASKNDIFLDEADSTVPETSPAEDRLRPMREIASISFGADGDLIGYVPGFTQDVDFDHAMGNLSSPAPPPQDSPRLPPPPFTLPSTMPSADLSTQAENKSEKRDGDSLAPRSNIPTNEVPEVVTEQEVDKDRQEAPDQPVIVEDAAFPSTGGNIVPGNVENDLAPASPALEPEAVAVQPAEENAGDETNLDGQETTLDPGPPSTKRSGLRSKNELKGPSRSLRQAGETLAANSATPRQTTRIIKSSTSKVRAVRSSDRLSNVARATPRSTPQRRDPLSSKGATTSATRSSARKSIGDPVPDKAKSPASAPPKRTSKRSSGVVVVHDDEETPVLTRSSKRNPTVTREDSADPLALPILSTHSGGRAKKSAALFTKMAFAVSYVNHEQDRDKVTKLILDNGGRILQDGFDTLFDVAETDLALSSTANTLGFTALIADEHSRKAKYMQALALGLPCISGHWITACVSKTTIVDWSPYLLCAGQSSLLGAHMSRCLQPYPADDATLLDTFAARQKLLDGKSVLLVAGRSEKRKPYVFLTRVLGPGRFEQVADNVAARKKLAESEAEGQQWDILYVESNIDNAEAVVFGSATTSSGSSKKRKRGPAAAEEDPSPVPKKIRMINDETMIQSLIVGHLLEE